MVFRSYFYDRWKPVVTWLTRYFFMLAVWEGFLLLCSASLFELAFTFYGAQMAPEFAAESISPLSNSWSVCVTAKETLRDFLSDKILPLLWPHGTSATKTGPGCSTGPGMGRGTRSLHRCSVQRMHSLFLENFWCLLYQGTVSCRVC